MSRRSKRRKQNIMVFSLSLIIALTLLSGVAIVYLAIRQDRELEVKKQAELAAIEERLEQVEQLQPEPIPEEPETEEEIVEEEDLTPPAKYADILADPEEMKRNHIYTRPEQEKGVVTMAFAGDILFDSSYAVYSTALRGGGIASCFSPELLTYMNSVDIMMLNNEFPYTDRGEATPEKTYTFRAKPDTVENLFTLGVDIVSLANNHMYDYGEVSLLDTLDTLEGASMPYVGAGRNIEEASKPSYFIVGDTKIGFINATEIERQNNPDTKGATENSAGVFRCLDDTLLLKKIREMKSQCDFLVVYIHWGTENVTEIDWLQQKQAPEIAEAGADLIIGAHPHILQGIEYVKDVPLIYSLGNFWFNSRTIDTGLLEVKLRDGSLESIRFVPCIQQNCNTILLEGAEKQRVLDYMQYLSQQVIIDAEGYVTRGIPTDVHKPAVVHGPKPPEETQTEETPEGDNPPVDDSGA